MDALRREVLWAAPDGTAIESLRLTRDGGSWVADGLRVGTVAGKPLRCLYQITCDRSFRVRQAVVDVPGGSPAVLRLLSDGAGQWATGLGEPLPALNGAEGLEIAGSPIGLTLALRRLALAAGASGTLATVRIGLPSLEPGRGSLTLGIDAVTSGRVTCADGEGTTTVDIDADALVRDWPGRVRLVWSDHAGSTSPASEPGPGAAMG